MEKMDGTAIGIIHLIVVIGEKSVQIMVKRRLLKKHLPLLQGHMISNLMLMSIYLPRIFSGVIVGPAIPLVFLGLLGTFHKYKYTYTLPSAPSKLYTPPSLQLEFPNVLIAIPSVLHSS